MFQLRYNEYDAEVYRKELKDFLPDTFIDIHTHVWKTGFKPYGASNGGATWTEFVADEQTAEDLLGAYGTLFPGKKVIPIVFGGCKQDVYECNAYVGETAKMYGYPTLLRTDYAMTGEEVERIEKGLVIRGNDEAIFEPVVIEFRSNTLLDLSMPSVKEKAKIVDVMKTMDNRIQLDHDLLDQFAPLGPA